MRRLLILPLAILVASAFIVSNCGNQSELPPGIATVKKVIDGDTIELKIGNIVERVRLIGIDTPETVHPTKGVECFGPEASNYVKQLLVSGTTVRVERDVEARDKYGRLLLYVYLAKTNMFVNLHLVAQGFATPMVFEPNTAHKTDFAQAATQAELNNVGLWQACR